MRIKSRTLICIVFLNILSLSVFAKTVSFNDIESGASYSEAVMTAAQQGFFKGDENGNFNPENTITRAEFAVLMCRLAGSEKTASKTRTRHFSDLDTSHWANGYVAWTEKNGIINGFDDGTFRPEGEVTQQQAAKMIICVIGKKAEAENLGGYPKGYEEVAKKLGMAEEVTNASLKRYEAAIYISGAVKEEEKSEHKKTEEKNAKNNLSDTLTDKEKADDRDGDSLTLKQEERDTCTACAMAMLLRRAYFLEGKDFSDITEEALKNDENVWLEGVGLYHNITFGKYNIVKRDLEEDIDKQAYFTEQIKKHPEGIIIYDRGMWHALLLTDVTNGTFYVCDPATGFITPIEETRTTEGFGAEEKINGIDSIWIMK